MGSPSPPGQGKFLLFCKTEGGGKGNERGGNRRAKKGQPGDGRVSASPVPSWVCFGTAQPKGGRNVKNYKK